MTGELCIYRMVVTKVKFTDAYTLRETIGVSLSSPGLKRLRYLIKYS